MSLKYEPAIQGQEGGEACKCERCLVEGGRADQVGVYPNLRVLVYLVIYDSG